MTGPDCGARVAAGAAFLDERMPGWAARIDLGSLNMMDDCYCVLGQLGGYYDTVVTRLGMRFDEEVSLGFMPGVPGAWDLLDAAWTAEIRKRRESAQEPDAADEADADWAHEWDDADSNAYQDRVEAGLEPDDTAEVSRR